MIIQQLKALQFDQLSYSCITRIDDDQIIYIANCGNHHIVRWKNGRTRSRVVDDDNGHRNCNGQLCCPTDITVDKESDYLII